MLLKAAINRMPMQIWHARTCKYEPSPRNDHSYQPKGHNRPIYWKSLEIVLKRKKERERERERESRKRERETETERQRV